MAQLPGEGFVAVVAVGVCGVAHAGVSVGGHGEVVDAVVGGNIDLVGHGPLADFGAVGRRRAPHQHVDPEPGADGVLALNIEHAALLGAGDTRRIPRGVIQIGLLEGDVGHCEETAGRRGALGGGIEDGVDELGLDIGGADVAEGGEAVGDVVVAAVALVPVIAFVDRGLNSHAEGHLVHVLGGVPVELERGQP